MIDVVACVQTLGARADVIDLDDVFRGELLLNAARVCVGPGYLERGIQVVQPLPQSSQIAKRCARWLNDSGKGIRAGGSYAKFWVGVFIPSFEGLYCVVDEYPYWLGPGFGFLNIIPKPPWSTVLGWTE